MVRDLGEDLVVQIYEDGASTGLTFYLQVKSTTDLENLRPIASPGHIHYPFQVKDLEHWEASATPVVLLVWDIQQRKGRWIDVPSAVKELDKTSKRWRRQKRATVRIPEGHSTSDEGRALLRGTLAQRLLPVIGRGRQLKFTPRLQFPNTNRGRAKLKELRKVIEEGWSIVLTGKEIVGFDASKWFERAVGRRIPDSLTFSPVISEKALPMQLVAVSTARTEVAALEMKVVRGGIKKITLNNDQQVSPFRVAIELPLVADEGAETVEMGFKMTVNHPSEGAAHTLEATKFLIALSEGGRVGIQLNGNTIGTATSKGISPLTLDELGLWEATMKKLCFIEARMGRFGRFNLKDGFGEKDLEIAERLFSIASNGSFRAEVGMSLGLTQRPKLLGSSPTPQPFSLRVPFGNERLLGVEIPIGLVEVTWDDPAPALEAMKQAAQDIAETPTVKIPSSAVTCRCLDWVPPNDGPPSPPATASGNPVAGRKSALAPKRKKSP